MLNKYASLSRPAVSLVLKTSGIRDDVGVGTSGARQPTETASPPFENIYSP